MEGLKGMQSCVSMYCNLWNICNVTSHNFSDYSSDWGIFKKAKWQSGSKFLSENSIFKTSIAFRILTPTCGEGLCNYCNLTNIGPS
jgi:hypothetical protein